MCMFGGAPRAIKRVDGTNILARSLGNGRQTLVYSMNVAARSPVAMILPLPVPPSPADDALRFIDMKGYPTFFHDLDKAFPSLAVAAAKGGFGVSRAPQSRPMLVVHEVGDFVASFVPSLGDFDRLDRRFRISDSVWEALPLYGDYGFAVFQLKDLGPSGWLGRLFGRAKAKTIHPMAFEFPRRDPGVLFFPTVHVHDGEVHQDAWFDHHLYAQLRPGERPATGLYWLENNSALGEHLDVERCREVIDTEQPCFSAWVAERRANTDILIEPAPLGNAA